MTTQYFINGVEFTSDNTTGMDIIKDMANASSRLFSLTLWANGIITGSILSNIVLKSKALVTVKIDGILTSTYTGTLEVCIIDNDFSHIDIINCEKN